MPARLKLLCLVVLGAALTCTASAAVAWADNWERFRGPNGSGIANDKNIPIKFSAAENVRWKAPIPGDGNSSPIVWGDRLFLQTASLDASDRSLLCLDVKTGKEIWKRTIPGTKVKFRSDSSHASATPTTDGEAVYVPFWNGKDIILTAYDFQGDKLWDRNLGEFVSQHGAGASPILYKNLLIFANDKDAFRDTLKKTGPVADPSKLFAFDKKTGNTVWEMPREANRACYSAPFILEKPGTAPELIVSSATAITSYEPSTGKPNWNWKWTFAKDLLRTVAATAHSDGLLLTCSGDGNGERLMVAVAMNGQGKEARPAQIWANGKFKDTPYVTCLLTRGEHVYFVSDYGRAACYHAKTGQQVWTERLPDPAFYASPVMIDGKIYAASNLGDVYVIAAEPTYKLIARNSIGEQIRATPAVANGALYIRTKSHLYCIGEK